MVTFERFSEYFENPGIYGLRLRPYPFYELTYPFGDAAASILATNFYDAGRGPCKQALSEWIKRLTQQCSEWKSRWNRQSGSFPCLYRYDDAGKTIVVDTRSGEMRSYPISHAQSDVLAVLRKPHSLQELIRALPDMDVEPAVKSLLTKGLLFRDEARYFNIVFPAKPQVLSVFKGKAD
ncbi:MAG: hypothetical protein GY850_44045 [bacterium]|nr:hypothetical protein [bacterium]